MTKGRVEAFSDGVIAIIITIMVLELRAPEEETFAALRPVLPLFFAYLLSFVNVGLYWNNHHHMFHAVERVNGPVLWANLHLLFWLSLFPFVTSWMDHNYFAPAPVALYGGVALMAGVAYYILVHALIRHHGRESTLARAVGKDAKGIVSVVLYALAIPLAFLHSAIALSIYAAVALMWFIPDRRIEKVLLRA